MILRSALLFVLVIIIASCGSGISEHGIQGPFYPFVEISSQKAFAGELPIEVFIYVNEETLMVNWDDGEGWSPVTSTESNNTLFHTYTQEGTYTIRVKALADGETAEDSFTITITTQETG
jgi:hypothetical protein